MVAKEVDLKEQSAEKYNVKLKDNRYLNKDINNKSDVKVSTANAKRKLASPKVGKFWLILNPNIIYCRYKNYRWFTRWYW